MTDNTESSYVTFVTLVLRRIVSSTVGIRIRVSYVFQRKFFFPPANALIFDELENIRNAVNFVECAKYDSLSSIVACFNSGETQFLTRPENRSKASKRRIKIKISRTGKRGTQFRTITFQPSSPSCSTRIRRKLRDSTEFVSANGVSSRILRNLRNRRPSATRFNFRPKCTDPPLFARFELGHGEFLAGRGESRSCGRAADQK